MLNPLKERKNIGYTVYFIRATHTYNIYIQLSIIYIINLRNVYYKYAPPEMGIFMAPQGKHQASWLDSHSETMDGGE